MFKSGNSGHVSEPDPTYPDDLFRARLSRQIDLRHPLVRLAGLVDRHVFERGSRRAAGIPIG